MEAELKDLRERVQVLEATLRAMQPAAGNRPCVCTTPPAPGRTRGRVKFFLTTRGFGFILDDCGGPDIFLHHTSFAARRGRRRGFASVGELVEFTLRQGERGPVAGEVTRPGGNPLGERCRRGRGSRRTIASSSFTDFSAGEINTPETALKPDLRAIPCISDTPGLGEGKTSDDTQCPILDAVCNPQITPDISSVTEGGTADYDTLCSTLLINKFYPSLP